MNFRVDCKVHNWIKFNLIWFDLGISFWIITTRFDFWMPIEGFISLTRMWICLRRWGIFFYVQSVWNESFKREREMICFWKIHHRPLGHRPWRSYSNINSFSRWIEHEILLLLLFLLFLLLLLLQFFSFRIPTEISWGKWDKWLIGRF